MPASGPAAASRNSALTSSAVDRPRHLEYAVRQARVQHRRAHRMAVQLALQFGIDQRDRGGTSRRGRRQRQHRRPRAPQILVRRIDHHVGVGRIMDRGDLAVADADRLVQHLHHGREAVGRAGRCGQQPMFARVIAMVVDADDDVERAGFLHRRRDDHPLHAALEISRQAAPCFRNLPVHSSTMSQPRSPQATPSAVGAALKPMRRLPTRMARSSSTPNVLAPAAVDAVEFQQMRGGCRAALEFVDMHDVEPVVGARIVRRPIHAAHRRAQREAADPAHAVDADAHGQRTPDWRRAGPPPISSSRAFMRHAVERGERQRREDLDPPAQAGVEFVQQRRSVRPRCR